jgi:hypothetical protein
MLTHHAKELDLLISFIFLVLKVSALIHASLPALSHLLAINKTIPTSSQCIRLTPSALSCAGDATLGEI